MLTNVEPLNDAYTTYLPKIPKGPLVTFIALRVISEILWSSCFQKYGPEDTR